jgi:hypothetical protein
MLFRKEQWAGLADGTITVAFRRQKRPSVKAGGTLRSPAGLLAIDAVTAVDETSLDDAAARAAGHADLADLLNALGPADPERTLYRVDFRRGGEDPRVALRQQDQLSEDELVAVIRCLDRLDRAAAAPWTDATLGVIADHPEVVSTELAALVGQERPAFKLNVRKLKGLGLTESLKVGYRLSPRGVAVLAHRRTG